MEKKKCNTFSMEDFKESEIYRMSQTGAPEERFLIHNISGSKPS